MKVIRHAAPWAQAAFHLMLYTGMRRSEVAALYWSDVDMDAETLRVVAAVDNIEAHADKHFRAPVKTARSNRVVQLGNKVVEVLREWKTQQGREADILPWGLERHASPYVFPGEKGGLLHPDRLTYWWMRAAKEARVAARLHDLRHTHASLMLSIGVELPVISARLGHSSVAVTGAVYSHMIAGRERAAVDKFDQLGARSGILVAKTKNKGLRR